MQDLESGSETTVAETVVCATFRARAVHPSQTCRLRQAFIVAICQTQATDKTRRCISRMIPVALHEDICMRTVAHSFASSVGLTKRAHSPGSRMHEHKLRHSRVQLRCRRGCKLAPRAGTAYEVAFTSEQPYYLLPEKRSMLQRITVVKVRVAWLNERSAQRQCHSPRLVVCRGS